MDALSAMRSLADLQAKFQPERLLSFDPEALLALSNEIENASESPLSPCQDFHATFETSSAAQLFDYRGEKVAGFDVNGTQMICLPQVYELFLKTMVGGLHTVYTKLKRLEISPLICNVEQVRALRGLGAIQPGVNRCKLIASSDFDRLYEDCTNTCTRPGRPPKRVIPPSDDWSAPKKELMMSGEHMIHPEDMPHLTVQNPMLLSNFLPQFTAHQLLVQHMMVMAQQKSLEVPSPKIKIPGPFAIRQMALMHLSGAEPSQASNPLPAQYGRPVPAMSTNIPQLFYIRPFSYAGQSADEGPSDGLSSDMGADVPTPLNLTKANSNSETCDSDSLENMRKVDASLSPSQCNSFDRGGSSSNGSNNSPSSETSAALSKIISLIDMTNEHFKQQKEALQKEREELAELRAQLKESLADENRLRHQLEKEKKRSSMFFRRYRKAKKEMMELKGQQVAASPQV